MHYVISAPWGADCSCGRRFSIWDSPRKKPGYNTQPFLNIYRANAQRHADAANAKIERRNTK